MFVLGMYLAPDGNNKDQVKYIHKNLTAWATSIISGVVQQNESWRSLNSTITQTMKHPLSAMTLNEEECKHIMQPIVKFGLAKDGISSTFHTSVRYGPRSLGGIILFDPSVIIGVRKMAFLINHYWKLNPNSPLLWSNLSNLKIEAGKWGRILEN